MSCLSGRCLYFDNFRVHISEASMHLAFARCASLHPLSARDTFVAGPLIYAEPDPPSKLLLPLAIEAHNMYVPPVHCTHDIWLLHIPRPFAFYESS
jgi:hypothetical protein